MVTDFLDESVTGSPELSSNKDSRRRELRVGSVCCDGTAAAIAVKSD